MLLRLRLYNPEVKYVGAKSVLMADTLSRLIKPGTDPAIPDLDVGIAEALEDQAYNLGVTPGGNQSSSSAVTIP